MPLNLVILFGSYRQDRLGIRVVRYVERKFAERGHTVRPVDAKDVDLPFLDRMYKDFPRGSAPPAMEHLAAVLRPADAFIVVTGEYNHGVQPGLKNLLDHFFEEYFWRPSAIVSYSKGPFAGARAAIQLREILAELGMPAIRSALPVPRVQDTLDDQGNPTDAGWDRRFGRFASELEWYAEALRAQRQKGTPGST